MLSTDDLSLFIAPRVMMGAQLGTKVSRRLNLQFFSLQFVCSISGLRCAMT